MSASGALAMAPSSPHAKERVNATTSPQRASLAVSSERAPL
eukprot:CAMPEP_0197698882 /NCGR_PEP_ID=MMETSP1338-20131121/119875_1 /TAXON_ID=43686 ORGANISM="Pelagodinium beii, Strain RCC1491" /NCGR_SAMPLE_ID=MMETSP1338 /ASSEMBLY_ACC=CAM_ASM_000754 /LENGTH=40 /DNA_ID= /DNA_START= /DNA_END= /DNA_ORIENTATION=